jgi:glutaminyl-peptide cyclotransferase
LAALLCLGAAPARAPNYGYRVVASFPHDRGAFTEGLFFHRGKFYESTGANGRSSIRQVDRLTGKVLQQTDLPYVYFGEGSIGWKDKIVQLTWRNQQGFIFDAADLKLTSSFRYPGEGWALTTDGRVLYMSDGTANLRILDPESLRQSGTIQVTDQGRPVLNINELEWVKGEIFANIWMTDRIVRIDPKTGRVTGWIDLAGLLPASERRGDEDVLNGIAYDAAGDHLYVTGKFWPKLYEIKLTGGR